MTDLIEGRDLVVHLQGHPVLRGVSACVRPGEAVALLGGNGSGKTTLVRTLLGLIPATSGDRFLFGTPLAEFRDWQRVGYVPQRGATNVQTATVREVVAMGRVAHRRPFVPASRADREAVDTALRRLDLTELADVRASRLSGGQYQRALIARALCTEPALLVLDEPLAALDMETQEALARRLLRLKDDGLGLLVVLHELGPMEDIIDRSIVLKGGRVIYDGPLRSGPGASDHHHPGDESGRDLLGHPLSGRGH